MHIDIKKPRIRWLFGGFGFHNSEATMTPLMSEKFKNEKVLKVFRELSPTYSRVFAGYADWTREAMDRFADYYDQTFRHSGTLLYLVPGRITIPDEAFNIPEHCEKVASNLEYLIKQRKCTKIRYYCVTNELSCSNTYAYLSNHLDLFALLHRELYKSFRRHDLDIGLCATDCSGLALIDKQLPWAIENIDNITEFYCGHLYLNKKQPLDPATYPELSKAFNNYVSMCLKKEKRFILGEYGLNYLGKWDATVMKNDGCMANDLPEKEGQYALSVAEIALAAINAGCFACVFWTLFDYPDPFIREDGDTPEEKARYEVSRFSGHGLEIRYNKNGLVRWCDDDGDYTSRASLYTLGYMSKFFRKGSRVLEISAESCDALRCAAVTNSDGSVTIAVINISDKALDFEASCECTINKPLRKYEYLAENPPYNDFCDLPSHSEVINAPDGLLSLSLPALSMVFLTTDYVDRLPEQVTGIKICDQKVSWNAVTDASHSYYRVYRDGIQIASTVATCTDLCGAGKYEVFSVDRHGNCRKGR